MGVGAVVSGRRLPIALGWIAVLVAACAGATPQPTQILTTVVPPPSAGATPEPTQASGSRKVSKADYGKAWPFTAASGTLACGWEGGRPLVTFTPAGGRRYGINGAARDGGFPKVTKKVLKKYPNLSTMQPLIDDGLEMCGAAP